MTKAVNGLLMENLLLQFFQKCAAGEGDEHGEVFVAGENDYGGEVFGTDFFGAFEGAFDGGTGGGCFGAEEFDGFDPKSLLGWLSPGCLALNSGKGAGALGGKRLRIICRRWRRPGAILSRGLTLCCCRGSLFRSWNAPLLSTKWCQSRIMRKLPIWE